MAKTEYQVEAATEPASRQPLPVPADHAAVVFVNAEAREMRTRDVMAASSEDAAPTAIPIVVEALLPAFESVRPVKVSARPEVTPGAIWVQAEPVSKYKVPPLTSEATKSRPDVEAAGRAPRVPIVNSLAFTYEAIVLQFWSRRLAARFGPLWLAMVLGIVRFPTGLPTDGMSRQPISRNARSVRDFMAVPYGAGSIVGRPRSAVVAVPRVLQD